MNFKQRDEESTTCFFFFFFFFLFDLLSLFYIFLVVPFSRSPSSSTSSLPPLWRGVIRWKRGESRHVKVVAKVYNLIEKREGYNARRFNQCNQWYMNRERRKNFTRFDNWIIEKSKRFVRLKLNYDVNLNINCIFWYQDQEVWLSRLSNNLKINYTLSLTNTLKILVFFRRAV